MMRTNGTISRKVAIWALIVIFTANFFNYIDRQLVSALETQISAAVLDPDRGRAEIEFGYLWSLFTIGYMLCAMPIGFLADHISRTKLFAVCIVIWSAATIASGMPEAIVAALQGITIVAEPKYVLYACRVFIGVGEAGCLVIGPALISDLFVREARGKALSVFYLGMPLGGTAAFIFAGVMPEYWRELFYLAGAPGFVIALLIGLLPDPPRGAVETPHHHGLHGGKLREYVQLLKNRTLLLIILAQTFAVIILIPLIHYGKKFFLDPPRSMKEGEAGIAMGLMALIAGALGTTLSGLIGDRLARRNKGAYALLAGIGYLAGWPCLLVGFLALDRWVYLPALTLGCFFYFLCMPAVNTQIANVVSPSQRATAWALAVFVLHLLGDMASPPVFGATSGSIGRQNAFVLFSAALVLAGVCALIAARTASADIARAAHQLEEEEKIEEMKEQLPNPEKTDLPR